jgi:hypothetical protein
MVRRIRKTPVFAFFFTFVRAEKLLPMEMENQGKVFRTLVLLAIWS